MVMTCRAARAYHTVCNVAQGLDRLDVEYGEAHKDDDKKVDDKLPRAAVQRLSKQRDLRRRTLYFHLVRSIEYIKRLQGS
jgi:hypothetical protein